MHRKWWNLIRIRTIEAGAEPGGGEPQQPEPPQSDPQANTDGEGDEKLGEHGMTALKNERRANKSLREQLAAANARIKEFEDRDKTDADMDVDAFIPPSYIVNEAQKLDIYKRIASLEKSNAGNAAKALRYEVAVDKQLPKVLAERLQGSTREELEADADSLLKLVNVQNKPNVKPDPSQGKGGDPKPHSLSEAISAYYK